MITAHLPVGYLVSRASGWRGPAMAAALVGSVFPDFDLLAFYLIDDRAVHHHRYWVHAPAFAAASAICITALAPRRLRPFALAFGAGWVLHVLCDSWVGQVMWLWPVSTEGYGLFTVSGVPGQHFLITILTHWTISLEVAIWATAAVTFWLRTRRD